MRKPLLIAIMLLACMSLSAEVTMLTTDAYWHTSPYAPESPGLYNFIVDDEAPVASNGGSIWAVDADRLTGRMTFKASEDIRALRMWNVAFDMFHDPVFILEQEHSYDQDSTLASGGIDGVSGAWVTPGPDAGDVEFSVSFVYRAVTSDGKVYRADLDAIADTLESMEPGFSGFENLPVLESFR